MPKELDLSQEHLLKQFVGFLRLKQEEIRASISQSILQKIAQYAKKEKR